MLTLLRNRFIAFGFASWVRLRRLGRWFRQLGRPSLGAVDHITLPVRDLDEARWFYCDVLGAGHLMTIDEAALRKFGRPTAPNAGQGSYHHSVFFGGTTRVDLFLQNTGQASPNNGHPHIAFSVPPRDMLRWKAKLEGHGVPTDGPLQLGPPGQASLYFNDPSGNHLEITCMGYAKPIPIRAPETPRLTWQRTVPISCAPIADDVFGSVARADGQRVGSNGHADKRA